jgi:hypothetical protein
MVAVDALNHLDADLCAAHASGNTNLLFGHTMFAFHRHHDIALLSHRWVPVRILTRPAWTRLRSRVLKLCRYRVINICFDAAHLIPFQVGSEHGGAFLPEPACHEKNLRRVEVFRFEWGFVTAAMVGDNPVHRDFGRAGLSSA